MKKLMCILLMLALCAALTACGSSDDPYGILSGDYQPAGGGEQTDGSSSSSSSAAEPEDSEIAVEVPAEGPQSGAYGYFVELADPYFGEGVYARIECNGFGENEFGEHYLVFTAYCKDDGSDPAPIFVEDLEGSALINGMPVTLRLGIEGYLMPGEFAGTSVVLDAALEELGLTFDDVWDVWLSVDFTHAETGERLEGLGVGIDIDHSAIPA